MTPIRKSERSLFDPANLSRGEASIGKWPSPKKRRRGRAARRDRAVARGLEQK